MRNTGLRRLRFAFVLASCAVAQIVSCARQPRDAAVMAVAPATLEQAVARLCAEACATLRDTCPCTSLSAMLDSGVSALRRDLPSSRTPDDTVAALNRLVYETWGMQFDPDRDNPRSVLPQSAVARRSGSCIGVSLLFLLVAERIHAPLFGVMPPTHFFVRYDNGTTRINIEPNRGGWRYTDDEYRVKYDVGDSSWYDLRNLTRREVIGVLEYNLANILRQRGAPSEALYLASVRDFPGFPEAWGNLAVARQQRGDIAGAIDALVTAGDLNPALPNLHRNLGLLYRQAGDHRSACETLREGLRRDPGNVELRELAVECHDD